MDPLTVKINAHAIHICDFLGFVLSFDLHQNRFQIDAFIQLYLFLGHKIGGILCPEFRAFHSAFGEMGQEEADANQRIAAIMAFGIDDASVAFASYHRIWSLSWPL